MRVLSLRPSTSMPTEDLTCMPHTHPCMSSVMPDAPPVPSCFLWPHGVTTRTPANLPTSCHQHTCIQ